VQHPETGGQSRLVAVIFLLPRRLRFWRDLDVLDLHRNRVADHLRGGVDLANVSLARDRDEKFDSYPDWLRERHDRVLERPACGLSATYLDQVTTYPCYRSPLPRTRIDIHLALFPEQLGGTSAEPEFTGLGFKTAGLFISGGSCLQGGPENFLQIFLGLEMFFNGNYRRY
jgi:hypothetical protein